MDMSKGIMRGFGCALAAAVLAFGLTGCRDDGGDRAAPDGPVIIAPGKPGEKSRTLSPEQAERERPDDSPNGADFAYVQRMIEHHRQAVTMTALAPERASGEPVKRLAERIAAAQKPEIGSMESWLRKHPAPAAPSGGSGQGGHAHHGGMPGMATEQQLAELGSARGEAFDRLFLSLMITHHEGAVTMAGEALSGGNNVAVEEMANDVVAQQTAEINRMRSMK
ncbi:DUF305 domain-containing protein [Streptomyces sp. NPDC089799]|uniref:DUF305 domain-containing protein n=1 Tax=Streptomyces sp. NPDC089799 TaxID=3155066 RepID=UPI003424DDC4